MKLERTLAAVFVLGAIGCGSAVSAPTAPVAPVVGTTRVTAADTREDVPRIGTPRYSHDELSKDDTSETPKDAPSRHGKSRPGGGFSGYK